jgi:Tripartite tricarboxylate transporter TctB family
VNEGQNSERSLGTDSLAGQPIANLGERGFRDLGLGVTLLGSTAALAYSAAIDADMHQNFGLDPGPSFLPNVLLWLLGIGATILVAQGVFGLACAGWRVPRPLIDIKRSTVPLLLVVSIIAYVLLVPAFGFLAVSLLFSVGWALGLAVQDHRYAVRPLLMSAGGSAVIAIGIYLAFKQLIGIPLG